MLGRPAIKRLVVLFVFTALWGALLFVSAGRVNWPGAWLYLALYCLNLAVNALVLAAVNPEVAAERGKKHEGTRRFDRVIGASYAVATFAIAVVAGLDAGRFAWSEVPFGAAWAGVALHVLGAVPSTWAMGVNRFLETTVRLQHDRGHEVVVQGPYRMVRHPMYLGAILQNLGLPLILGSLWAYLPVGLIVGLLVVRTALEDVILRKELPGYEAYAHRTRYRLVPLVW